MRRYAQPKQYKFIVYGTDHSRAGRTLLFIVKAEDHNKARRLAQRSGVTIQRIVRFSDLLELDEQTAQIGDKASLSGDWSLADLWDSNNGHVARDWTTYYSQRGEEGDKRNAVDDRTAGAAVYDKVRESAHLALQLVRQNWLAGK